MTETLPDASPWASLTDEVRPPRRRGGVSAVALLAVVLSVAASVALGASLVLKALAR